MCSLGFENVVNIKLASCYLSLGNNANFNFFFLDAAFTLTTARSVFESFVVHDVICVNSD